MTPFLKAMAVSVIGISAISVSAIAAQHAGPREGGMHGKRMMHMLMRMDTDKDGAVTRGEAESQARTHFAKADANSDGSVTQEELRNAMKDAMKNRHENRKNRRDTNKDGTVSKEEFLSRHNKRFEKLDADSDGSISKSEFSARPEKAFSCLDKNNDGALSADEKPQRDHKGRHHKRGGKKDGKEGRGRGGHFERVDADSNGSLSEQESVDAALKRFDRADKNEDGKITKEDFKRPERKNC